MKGIWISIWYNISRQGDYMKTTLYIVNHSYKEKMLKENKFLDNKKYMSLEEFKKSYLFDYDEEAIYYLQKSLGNNKSVSLENYITYIMLANSYLKKKDFSNCLRCLDGLFKLEQNIKEEITMVETLILNVLTQQLSTLMENILETRL